MIEQRKEIPMQGTTTKKPSGHRVAAVVATIVTAASLAAGAQALQPTSAVALPSHCDDEWGCGANHNEVLSSVSAP